MKSENLSNILKSSGFKNIELDNIIESKHILKRSGGNFRQYLFSFYDQRNVEWSLRPDLTLSSVIKFIGIKDQRIEAIKLQKLEFLNYIFLVKLLTKYLEGIQLIFAPKDLQN